MFLLAYFRKHVFSPARKVDCGIDITEKTSLSSIRTTRPNSKLQRCDAHSRWTSKVNNLSGPYLNLTLTLMFVFNAVRNT